MLYFFWLHMVFMQRIHLWIVHYDGTGTCRKSSLRVPSSSHAFVEGCVEFLVVDKFNGIARI